MKAAQCGFRGFRRSYVCRRFFSGAFILGAWMAMVRSVFAQEGGALYISVGSPCRVTACVDVLATSIGDDPYDTIDVFGGSGTVLSYTGSDMSGANNWAGSLCGLVKGANNVYAYSEELDIYSDPTTVTLTAYDATQAEVDFQDPWLQPTSSGWQQVRTTCVISSVAIHYEPGASTAAVSFSIQDTPASRAYRGAHTLNVNVSNGQNQADYAPESTVASSGVTQSHPYLPAPPPNADYMASGWERYLRAKVSSDGCEITSWSLFQPQLW